MRAFEGIKILDCTHVIAAPFATYQLAIQGADVIKLEDPNAPDQSRLYSSDKTLTQAMMGTGYMAQASNKRAIALDLKTEKGREVLRRLVADWADVLVENYRPGAFKALALGYDDLSKLNPRLIYASMSAFGQDGPRSAHTAFDPAIEATSGLTASTGTATSGPVKGPAPVVDYATGMAGAFAIASALFQRSRTGRGQYIDLAMFDVALMLQGTLVTNFLQSGHHPKRGDKPRYGSNNQYPAKEGLIQLSAVNMRQQTRFYKAIGREDKAVASSEQRMATFNADWEMVAEKMKERTAEEWESYLQANHVPAARVRELPEALADPQLKSRGLLHHHKNVAAVNKPLTVPMTCFKFAHDGPSIERPPPRFAEHTDEVLAGVGYSTEEIRLMREARVIA